MIKAIISDVGNVLVSVDLKRWLQAFNAIGVSLPEHLLDDPELRTWVTLHGMGRVDTDMLKIAIAKRAGLDDIPLADFCGAWNEVILEIRNKDIEVQQNLRQAGYKLYALSDINPIHLDYIEALFQDQYPNQTFSGLFDACYYSHLTGYVKSNDNAWLQILNRHQLKPVECLFIDDLDANIDRAKKLGIPAFHFTPGKTMEEVGDFLRTI